MPTKDEMLQAQHKALQTIKKQMREQSNQYEIMRMQNYEYRTMIMRLLQVFEDIDQSDDLPAFEYSRFVKSKVAATLREFGRASTFANQTEPKPLEEVKDRYDD